MEPSCLYVFIPCSHRLQSSRPTPPSVGAGTQNNLSVFYRKLRFVATFTLIQTGGQICQEVTEKAHPGGAALEQGGVQEWEEPGEEEWTARGLAQGQRENASVQNVKRLLLMKQERRATL
jgi:hypothetical protein